MSSSTRRVLPNFLIIGAMKGGTTALHDYLDRHPQVFMSRPKELNFFVQELNWVQGVDWYAEHFREAGGAIAVGEASPQYTKAPQFGGVPQRIESVLPDPRFVYVIRDPIERIRSAYLHRFARGDEQRPADRAVLDDPRYVDESRYAYQLEPYVARFGRRRIHVIRSERLRGDRAGELDRLCAFLGVQPFPPVELPDIHRSSDKSERHPAIALLGRVGRGAERWVPSGFKRRLVGLGARPLDVERARLSPGVEDELRRRLADDTSRLEELLGHDPSRAHDD